MKKIVIGADYKGFKTKEKVKEILNEYNHEYKDIGGFDEEKNDFTTFGIAVAEEIMSDKAELGILICGSGVGVCITANRFSGIRAGLITEVEQVREARENDDINVLCISSDYTDDEKLHEIVKNFIDTEFEDLDRRKKRLNTLSELGSEI